MGKVGGSTAGVDLDAFGYGINSSFGYVRLRDDPLLDGQSGATVGADIDAVGAISTIRVTAVPEPQTWALLLAGLVAARIGAGRCVPTSSGGGTPRSSRCGTPLWARRFSPLG